MTCLKMAVIGLILNWEKEVKALFFWSRILNPHLIFVFRDGVSNSEFSIVKEHEVEAMKESFLQIDPAYK